MWKSCKKQEKPFKVFVLLKSAGGGGWTSFHHPTACCSSPQRFETLWRRTSKPVNKWFQAMTPPHTLPPNGFYDSCATLDGNTFHKTSWYYHMMFKALCSLQKKNKKMQFIFMLPGTERRVFFFFFWCESCLAQSSSLKYNSRLLLHKLLYAS